jgi:hypothetical protein
MKSIKYIYELHLTSATDFFKNRRNQQCYQGCSGIAFNPTRGIYPTKKLTGTIRYPFNRGSWKKNLYY